MKYWSGWVLMPAVSARLQWLGLVVLVSHRSTLFRPVSRQLPVIPLECAMRKAVGFHPLYVFLFRTK